MVQENNQNSKLKYPRSVFFIIVNEFCERFTFYGLKTILILFLSSSLRYNNDTSTILYHIFVMLCYFFPIFGAIFADSFLGKYRTILYLSVIYCMGSIILSLSAIPVFPIAHRETSLIGLLLIAIGTGGIKPCVSSFGGDQFILPAQALELQRFFSIFYFSINAGSLLSTYWTPNLRNDVHCFGETSCFSLAFGVPAILMIISLVIFVCGKSMYIMKKPKDNIIITFSKCIMHALRNKITAKNNSKQHWLYYADDKYSENQISEIRAVLNVLYLFIPVPLFWALFDQQGSRWTFQAANMDGRLFGFVIKPDQMQVVNPLLILAFIPIFELYVYPTLTTVGIKRPLQKIVTGGFLAATAFFFSACVEFFVQESYVQIPEAGYGKLQLFNTLNCNIVLNPPIYNLSNINALSSSELNIPVTNNNLDLDKIVFQLDNSCPYNLTSFETKLRIAEQKTTAYLIKRNMDMKLLVSEQSLYENLKKDGDGLAQISIYYSSSSFEIINLEFDKLDSSSKTNPVQLRSNEETNFILLPPGRYNFRTNNNTVNSSIIVDPGQIDLLLISENGSQINYRKINLAPSNKVHMLWQLPQFITITAGEIMFSITGLEFSFTQAPQSMKTVLSAVWLLTVAFGNLIVVVITEIHFFHKQAYEFLLFAVLMILDMLLFIFLSMKYTYVNAQSAQESIEETNDMKSSTNEEQTISNLDETDERQKLKK